MINYYYYQINIIKCKNVYEIKPIIVQFQSEFVGFAVVFVNLHQ